MNHKTKNILLAIMAVVIVLLSCALIAAAIDRPQASAAEVIYEYVPVIQDRYIIQLPTHLTRWEICDCPVSCVDEDEIVDEIVTTPSDDGDTDQGNVDNNSETPEEVVVVEEQPNKFRHRHCEDSNGNSVLCEGPALKNQGEVAPVNGNSANKNK